VLGSSFRPSRQVCRALRGCVAAALVASCAGGERLACAADASPRLAFSGGVAGRGVAWEWKPALPLELTMQLKPAFSASPGGVIWDGTVAHG
jgi:hypothetical protein